MRWETRSPLGNQTSVGNTLVCSIQMTSEVLSRIRFWRDGEKGFFAFLVCSCSVSGISFTSELFASYPRDVHQKKFLAANFDSRCIFLSLMLCKLWLLLVLSVSNLILCVSMRICNFQLPIYHFFPCYHSHYFLYVWESLWQIVLCCFLGWVDMRILNLLKEMSCLVALEKVHGQITFPSLYFLQVWCI